MCECALDLEHIVSGAGGVVPEEGRGSAETFGLVFVEDCVVRLRDIPDVLVEEEDFDSEGVKGIVRFRSEDDGLRDGR